MAHFTRRVVLAIQQVYFLLLERGPVPAFSDPVQAISPFWKQSVMSLTQHCVELSQVLREIRLGSSAVIVDGEVRFDSIDEVDWSQELNANIWADEQVSTGLDRYRNDPNVRRIEREVFDYSVLDAFELFSHPEKLREFTRVTVSEEFLVVDLGPGAQPIVRRMAEDFMVTRERIQWHAAPSYFFAAGKPVARSYLTAVEQATEMDWLTYAPLLSATYHHEGKLVPAVLTSFYLLHRAASTAAGSVAFRLHNAVEVAKRRHSANAKHVSALVREFHAAFEHEVAGLFAAGGLTTRQGLERLNRRPIPCGEIDVIAWGPGTDRGYVVVVCEAKNNDVTFHKDLGIRQGRALMERARTQVTTKATWVAANWPDLAPELDADPLAVPVVVAFVVTRLAALPVGPGGAAFVAAHEVEPIAQDLTVRPPGSWRPDVRAAILASGA
jgi:hypothetical protein